VCGFILIDYGFNVISFGLPGARTFTSQFLGSNLLLGGSVLVFVSLYFILKPVSPIPSQGMVEQPTVGRPDVGVEIIVEEETPPKLGFYKSIEYIGYFFAFLGLISAADLVMQVFLRSTYNELRWWIEALLVTFGVLSYTIFGSVGRLGLQEEARLANTPTMASAAKVEPEATVAPQAPPAAAPATPTETIQPLTLRLAEFTRNSEGEYEKNLSGDAYDMFRVDSDLVTVWREDRREMRSIYLAGPYELTRQVLEEYLSSGQELRVGDLALSTDTIRGLLELMKSAKESEANV
jgi:hypothetical protein